MQSLVIVLMFTAASVAYGVAQDLALVRVCPEFFTLGKPEGTDPVGAALLQGVTASWWGGAILGVAMAAAGRIGSRPKYSWRMMLRPVAWLLGATAALTVAAGIIGGVAKIILPDAIRAEVSFVKWSAFQACWCAHWTSYFVAFMAGGMQVVAVWLSRRRLKGRPSHPLAR